MRKLVLEYLLEHPCEICNEAEPIVLDFDHLDPASKKYNISKMLSGHYGWKTILSEIKKCRILCSNCHRKHTYKQQNYWGKS